MCMFTGPVPDVSGTKIFARLSGRGTQYLVYQMTYRTADDVAMVLPLPVSSRAEDAVRFIALDCYVDLFDDLNTAFHAYKGEYNSRSLVASADALQVHSVGDFEASFVPALAEFDRLDPRFTLPRQVWDQLPAYAGAGFAVFKLSPGRTPGTDIRVHPMAFEFPTALPETLFFPTVHVHDEQVHQSERFDHSLYWQHGHIDLIPDLKQSHGPMRNYVHLENAQGIIDGNMVAYKLRLRGLRENRDTFIGEAAALA